MWARGSAFGGGVVIGGGGGVSGNRVCLLPCSRVNPKRGSFDQARVMRSAISLAGACNPHRMFPKSTAYLTRAARREARAEEAEVGGGQGWWCAWARAPVAREASSICLLGSGGPKWSEWRVRVALPRARVCGVSWGGFSLAPARLGFRRRSAVEAGRRAAAARARLVLPQKLLCPLSSQLANSRTHDSAQAASHTSLPDQRSRAPPFS